VRTEQTKYAWRFAGPSVVVLLLLTLVFYQHTVLYLTGLWNQLDIGEYAHGYLVLAISGYLIFNKRQTLSALTPCPEYRALLAVVAASMLWMVSALVDVEMLQAVGLLLLVLVLVWTVLGNQVMRVLAFPILFIGFAIPIWSPFSPVLQNLAADSVFWAIRLLSIPALRQDNMIVLPAGTLSIEEACSGLRYLLAALTLGTLYAYMNYSSLRARLIVVLVSAGSAVLANMLRVFIVVYLAYTTEMQHPFVDDHLSLGWYLFAGLIAILLFLDARLHSRSPLAEPGEPGMQQDVTTANVCKPGYPYIMFVAGAGLLVSIAPAVVYQANHPSAGAPVNAAPELPQQAGGWTRTRVSTDSWMPVYHGAVNQQQLYQKDSDRVVLYMGYYPTQKQGEELINDLNNISNEEVWRTVYPRARVRAIGNQQVLEQMLDNRAKQQRLVWYWYNVAGKLTTNKYEAKLLQVLGLLTGESWAFVVAVAAQTGDDPDSTRQLLKDFIVSIEKEVERIPAQR
jgi:exosortase A